MNRRQFIKMSGISFLGVACPGLLQAKPAAPANASKPRPLGTCGGFVDADRNGSCDRSERKTKPCGATKCPGHVHNPARAIAARDGAPAGSCAGWRDPRKSGFCALSAARPKACLYKVCPAHRGRPF